MTYMERTKTRMTGVDWVYFAVSVFGCVGFLIQAVLGNGLAVLGALLLGFAAFCIWWGNVAPYRPKIGRGPHG